MPICAYCKQERPATREHVIPAFMYSLQKQAGEGVIGWNEAIERMIGGESKIKDVCAECNNGFLSDLDSYGQRLLSDAGLLVQNYLKQSIPLRYDYGTLLRWLLKISYNSSRTDGAHRHLFEEHIPFILGNASVPPRYRIGIAAYMASAAALDEVQVGQEPFLTASRGSRILNPFLVRICYGFVPGGDFYTLRINIFGPLVLYMLFFNDGTLPGHASAAIRRFLKLTPGAVELRPTRRFAELRAGEQSWVDMYAHQVQRARALDGGA